jgi:hypothetical protein
VLVSVAVAVSVGLIVSVGLSVAGTPGDEVGVAVSVAVACGVDVGVDCAEAGVDEPSEVTARIANNRRAGALKGKITVWNLPLATGQDAAHHESLRCQMIRRWRWPEKVHGCPGDRGRLGLDNVRAVQRFVN